MCAKCLTSLEKELEINSEGEKKEQGKVADKGKYGKKEKEEIDKFVKDLKERSKRMVLRKLE